MSEQDINLFHEYFGPSQIRLVPKLKKKKTGKIALETQKAYPTSLE